MNYQEEKDKITLFTKIGIIVLSFVALIIVGIQVIPDVISVSSTSGKRELPIYCVNCPDKKVALSFDAAWGNEDTQTILSILAKYNVHVTFFMTGGWIAKYPDDVKAIAAAGHDLGNHSENHKQMSQLSKEECIKELMGPHDKVKALTGVDMQLFRPPYGDYNNTLIEATKECNYHCIQWDVDSLDWKDYGADSIVKTVVNHKHLGNGSIILMHNGAKFTKDALPAVIEGLQNKGYEIVPISELIYKDNYYMDHEGRQFQK
ncbi:polysaccharide deacetylase family protein [Anaeromicropila herbilytica]|uniref:Polysaccharide deacetylase family sporulation protein PdaB n=1 Tax=Anaeromicropila herbilytica TaxID=2785025 RepID=A0A7R7EJI0_9FIRM|nr:polysaccharide deacetylase family protein [Anaeromicropila herbilytica]BCN29981.1 polysaccharide deacetylase family sporulation protein PdaB [Anaeromicropila herbilytica]